jgi:hypothetical protein
MAQVAAGMIVELVSPVHLQFEETAVRPEARQSVQLEFLGVGIVLPHVAGHIAAYQIRSA